MWNKIKNLFKSRKIETPDRLPNKFEDVLIPKIPSVTAIIVFSPEEAERLGKQIPDSVIVGKVRKHVKSTSGGGLAGDISKVNGRHKTN